MGLFFKDSNSKKLAQLQARRAELLARVAVTKEGADRERARAREAAALRADDTELDRVEQSAQLFEGRRAALADAATLAAEISTLESELANERRIAEARANADAIDAIVDKLSAALPKVTAACAELTEALLPISSEYEQASLRDSVGIVARHIVEAGNMIAQSMWQRARAIRDDVAPALPAILSTGAAATGRAGRDENRFQPLWPSLGRVRRDQDDRSPPSMQVAARRRRARARQRLVR